MTETRVDLTDRPPAGLFYEDLQIGMRDTYSRVVTCEDVHAFAAISGDHNPVHLDERYAEKTPFAGRIAHGLLTASFLSSVLGMRLPGPGAIYISQSLNFRAPVRIGDRVEASAQITDLCGARRRATLACLCKVGEKTVVDGEAIVLVPSRRV